VGELSFDGGHWMTVPQFSPTSIPVLPSLSLSDSEREMIAALQNRAQHDRVEMECANSFYMGAQIIRNLDIAIPDDLASKLTALVGWARIAVDPYVERLSVEGFRLPGDTDVNPDLGELWAGNGLESEQSLAFTDALSFARAYWLVGSRPGGGLPLITAESPLNMAVLWDLTGTTAKAALQSYVVDDQRHAALMLPEQTITIAEDESKVWQLVNRDQHGFGRVPVHRMANAARTNQRDGFSNITPELQSVITNACRRLMGLEVASELYSVPRLWLLGASLSDFQGPDGQMKRALETYMSMMNALERDEDGNAPELKQLTTYDPATFTKVLEMYASQAAGILAAVPQDLGLYTQGNPTSSEAWDSMETRRNRRAISMTRQFGTSIVAAMQDGIRFQNNGALPREFERAVTDWAPIMPGKTADDISKLVAAGAIPPRSDVTLKHAGFNAVERAQMEQDWAAEDQRVAKEQVREQIRATRPVEPVSDADGVAAG
jgi:hypothetical protein